MGMDCEEMSKIPAHPKQFFIPLTLSKVPSNGRAYSMVE
jgi:hypothetical protein